MKILQNFLLTYLLTECFVTCLEFIPERVALIYANPKYLRDVQLAVRRYSRKTPYVLNIDGVTLHTWANNISVQFIFYEFLHNEFRRSFIEMKNKFCDLLMKDPFISPVMRNTGITCPLPKGHQVYSNLTMSAVPYVQQLPYKWPFEKGKVVALFHTLPEKELIAEVHLVATFISNTKKTNKKS